MIDLIVFTLGVFVGLMIRPVWRIIVAYWPAPKYESVTMNQERRQMMNKRNDR